MQENNQEGRIVNVNQQEEPVHIRLPLGPGSIAGGEVRNACYKMIERDLQAFVTKWGFRDYNFQMEWPDSTDQPPVIVFNSSMPAYKTFLSQMLMKIATMSAANKLKFVKELVQVVGALGMGQQLKLFVDQMVGGQEQGFRDAQEED